MAFDTTGKRFFLSGLMPAADGILSHRDGQHLLGIYPSMPVLAPLTLAGLLNFSGSTAGLLSTKALSGRLTFSGRVVRQTVLILGGTLSFNGAESHSKIVSLSTGGQLTFSGSPSPIQAGLGVGGQLTFNGRVGEYQLTQSLGGLLTFNGRLSKMESLTLSGLLSFVGRIRGRNPLWLEIHTGERWLGEWAAGTTYAAGDVVLYTDGGEPHAFKSKAAANLAHLPTDPAWWDRLVPHKWED